jgi:Vacuolar protein sorting-associated protein 26
VRAQQFRFDFAHAENVHETYNGLNAHVRYLVRVTITRTYGTITKDFEFAVQNLERVSLQQYSVVHPLVNDNRRMSLALTLLSCDLRRGKERLQFCSAEPGPVAPARPLTCRALPRASAATLQMCTTFAFLASFREWQEGPPSTHR